MDDPHRRRSAVADLRAALQNGPSGLVQGLSNLTHAYGSSDRLLDCYLRCGGVRWDVAKAKTRLVSTLAFRAEHGLDSLDVRSAFEEHPVRAHFRTAFAPLAPDGCVVQYTRLAGLRPRYLMDNFSEQDVCHFMVLWLETSLRMQGDSNRARTDGCPGVYDVYDAAGFKFSSLLRDASATRALARLMSVGEQHYPENLHKCFVINAPTIAQLVWKLLKPAISAETSRKVQISSGVPSELKQALGGHDAVQEMMAAVPPPGNAP